MTEVNFEGRKCLNAGWKLLLCLFLGVDPVGLSGPEAPCRYRTGTAARSCIASDQMSSDSRRLPGTSFKQSDHLSGFYPSFIRLSQASGTLKPRFGGDQMVTMLFAGTFRSSRREEDSAVWGDIQRER